MSDAEPIVRGFGWTYQNGYCRWWYIDKEGIKRWSDNDKAVEGE
jgi:hypothetical protein